MNEGNHKLRKLTPERVIEDLAKDGITLTIEEAEIILKFTREIACIAVNQYLSGRLNPK